MIFFFFCSKQLDGQRFSLWFSQVALGSWDIKGQQIFLVLRRATLLFNIQLLHHTFLLVYNGSIPGLEHLPWGLDCNCFGHPVLEIFLRRASLTLSFRCGGDKKRKIKKSCSAACCCTENAFPLISQTSNRALPLPVNPFHHHRASLEGQVISQDFGPHHADPCSGVPTVGEWGGWNQGGLETEQLFAANLCVCVYIRKIWLSAFCWWNIYEPFHQWMDVVTNTQRLKKQPANQLLCCTYLGPEQGGWSLRWSRTSQKEPSHYVSPESGL